MARNHFAKKSKRGKKINCSKCGKKIKPGEHYSFRYKRYSRRMRGFKVYRCSKCGVPTRAELTSSDKLARIYTEQDNIFAACQDARRDQDCSNLPDTLRNAASEIEQVAEDYKESAQNMESAFPNGCPVMSDCEQKAEDCESYARELEEAADEIESVWELHNELGERPDELEALIEQLCEQAEGVDCPL